MYEMLPLFRAVLKFYSMNWQFSYFQRRYSKKLRGSIRTTKFSLYIINFV